MSYITGRPVLDDILYYLPATLQLGGLALLTTLVMSIPLGLAVQVECFGGGGLGFRQLGGQGFLAGLVVLVVGAAGQRMHLPVS